MRRKRHVVAARNVHRRTVAATAMVARASLVSKPSTLSPIPRGAVIRGGPWLSPTYADSTTEDFIDGEDLDVRRAAVEALGPYNGSVVVSDAGTCRILAMVNQKLALGSGFQPCSTIKVSVALTALHEKVITPTEKVNGIDLKYALAHSNNYFFATLGNRMGYDTVSKYAHLFGYGEKAGLNIPGEQPGHYPVAPPKNGGMGMLTSFGEEISQTPLELAALMGALANGGKLYYLQYPRTQAEAQHFTPKIKRELDIKGLISQVKPGMLGAVEYGTARRIMHAVQDQPIAGKTGTCTDSHTHLGWFGSFNDSGPRKLVVVVLLTGGRPVVGPVAAGVAGDVYKNLGQVNYFAKNSTSSLPAALLAMPMCCK
jgi:cell division protein FtsI/penicillin-binding protein 2